MINAHLDAFSETLQRLATMHPRRLGLYLAQLGILLTAAGFCVSIAAMNIGLTASLVGCVIAGAPLYRLSGFWPYTAFLATLLASTAFHAEWVELVKTAVLPIGLLTAQVAFHHAVPGAERFRRITAYILIACVLASLVVALGQFFIGRGRNRPFRIDPAGSSFSHASGFYGLHLTQGGIMGMVLFILSALSHGLPAPLRWGSCLAAIIGMLLSFTRAALLGLAAGIFAALAVRGRRYLVASLALAVIVLGGGLTAFFMLQPERFQKTLAMQDGRWPIWRTSIQVMVDHPLVGTGGSHGFREAFRQSYPEVVPDIPPEFPNGAPHAHNTQLAHAAEHGIPHAIAWLALLGASLMGLWQQRHDHPVAWQSGVGLAAFALVFGQFEKIDGECSRTLWTGLGILLALSAGRTASQQDGRGSAAEAI